MKTIVLNKMFYIKPSVRVDGMFDVWKNNGADAPDQLVGDPFATPDEADAFARKLEAKMKAAEPDNRSMKNATDILLDYLVDNPEITKCLLDKATKHVAAKRRAEAIVARTAELTAKAITIDREINRLKGRILSLQKARKAIVNEAIALSKELGV